MKTWMKVLFWLGTGCGFGFFIGYQAGQRTERKRAEEAAEEEAEEETEKRMDIPGHDDEYWETMTEYLGQKPDQEETAAEEPPEMVMEPPVIDELDEGPNDIPRLHPQHMVPEIITELEANRNPWGYETEKLIYYTGDEVLYNTTTQTIEEDPDSLLGIGALASFGGDPNNPVETIWVKHDTWGKIFRVDAFDDIFADAVDGNIHPDDDDLDEDDEEGMT